LSNILKYKNAVINNGETVLLKNQYMPLYTDLNDEKVDKNDSISDFSYRAAEIKIKNMLDKANRNADAILVDAAKQAHDIMKTSKREGYEKGYNEGLEDGYKAGYEKGKAEAEAQFQNKFNKLDKLYEDFQQEKRALYKTCENDMVRLSIDIATKVLDSALEGDQTLFLKLAQKILEESKNSSCIKLRVSSYDYPIVISKKDYLLSVVPGVKDMEIVEDKFLKRGSCIADTDLGIIDGSIEKQISKIQKAFLSIMSVQEKDE
jgi:flagellar assembly protein FliH